MPRSVRRSTRSGRRGSLASSPGASGADRAPATRTPLSQADTPVSAVAPEPIGAPSAGSKPVTSTRRFEDEATIERHHASHRYDDLEESTNVMSRQDLTGAATRRKKTARVSRPPSMPPEADAADRGPDSASTKEAARIMAFKVAVAADSQGGAASVFPLAPNEPVPAGCALAILVPVDGSSSALITQLLSRPKRGG